MIRRQNGNRFGITFIRFLRTYLNCRFGRHTDVQMDSNCMYCNLRMHQSGNNRHLYPEWPLRARGWSRFKMIASHFYCWD